MDPIEQRVRESLRARAGDAEPTPHLYRGVQDRIAKRRRAKLLAWVPAGAAALGVAVAVPMVLTSDPGVPNIEDYAEEQPASATTPDRAVVVDDQGEVGLLDLRDGTSARPRGYAYPGTGEVIEIDVAPSNREDVPTVHALIADADAAGGVELAKLHGDGNSGRGVDERAPETAGRFAVSPDGRWTATLSGDVEDADAWILQLRETTSGPDGGRLLEPAITAPGGSVVQDWTGSTSDGGESQVTVVTPDGLLLGYPLLHGADPEPSFTWVDEEVTRPVGEREVAAYASSHLGDETGFVLETVGDGAVVQAVDGEEVLGQVDVSELIAGQDPSVIALDAWGDTASLATPEGSWLLTHDGEGDFGEPVALPEGTVRAALVGKGDAVAAPAVPGEPTHTLLGLEDGRIVVADLEGRDRQDVWNGDGEVQRLTAAAGSTAERFRAASVVVDQDGQASVSILDRGPNDTTASTIAAVDLPGGTGQPPAVALSSDGAWLAYTGVSQTVDAAVAVYVAPLDSSAGTLDADLDAFEEVYTVASGDPSDAIVDLIQWAGPTGEGDESHLYVLGPDGQGVLVLQRGDEGFEVQQRVAFDGVSRDALDLSNAFIAADPIEDPVFLLERGEDGLPAVRFEDAVASTDQLGADPDEVALDARGRTALLVGGGSAITVRFDGADDGASVSVSPTIEDVTAGALLGGVETAPPPEDDRPTEPEDDPNGPAEEPTEPWAEAMPGDGMVVADDRTVTLVRPGGSTQELVTFPTEGESTVVAVAVRPGSTVEDLTVAITTRAEGGFDVRWLRVVGGEVDDTSSDFPAPVIEGANGFPLDVPDLQDGSAPAAVWSPEGDLLAVVVRASAGAVNEVRTIGWGEDGPSDDPNLAPSYELDTDRPLTARQWVWTDDVDGVAREGELLLVDELAREAFSVRLDRSGDGAPAMPAQNPLQPIEGAGVLDIADLDGDGTVDAVLRVGDPVPVLELRDGVLLFEGGPVDVALEYTGPREANVIAGSRELIIVVLDPAQPVLIDQGTGRPWPIPLDGEVVSADLIR